MLKFQKVIFQLKNTIVHNKIKLITKTIWLRLNIFHYISNNMELYLIHTCIFIINTVLIYFNYNREFDFLNKLSE